MRSGFPFSGRVRRLFKRIAHSAKKVLRPKTQTPPNPLSPGSAGDPPLQTKISHSPVPALPPQLLPQSRKPVPPPQPVPSTGQLVPTTLRSTKNGSQSTSAIEKWAGLRATLQLLERSLDSFPNLKSAVAEFLGVLNTLEASGLFEVFVQNTYSVLIVDYRPEPKRVRRPRL